MDLTLLISAIVFFGLIGAVTAIHKSGDEPSIFSQSGGSKKSGKLLFLAFVFLAVIFVSYMF